MPIAERTASVVWDGSLAGGGGTLDSGSGAFTGLPVTWAARTEAPGGKTSPEELIAGAHAACFTMALALVLGESGTPPDRLAVDASCTLDEVNGAPRITRVALSVHGRVDGLDESTFQDAVGRAAALCPVSNAIRGNVEISVDANLDAA
ncbi:MAG TPA: OsmC family peroxiredoxin [Gaiellaceae bacterium]|nr:OsmC family peroxiredoxin [Gaiellaceae bacterium]